MKTEILKLLKENDGYVSGQQLCEKLGVSRTAVWKVINSLKEEGYQIEAVRNKGYIIKESPDIITKEEILSKMHTAWAAQETAYRDIVDSTNTLAKELAEKGCRNGMLVVADMQSAGKGRRGRAWVSPRGMSIYMSIALRPKVLPVKAPMLTLIMAYSIVQAIRKMTGLEALIKWPNDIVVHGKKVCGILTEMSTEIDYINYVVIGAGINVNTEHFEEEIRETATSLLYELDGAKGDKIKRSELIAASMEYFEQNYEQFLQTEDLTGILEAYNQVLVNCGREVKVLEPGNEYRARAMGINEKGELLVEKEDGAIEKIYAGEVSVRGIYGYV